MGRRKISIEPILHERNRSVTFLKRKNGLFKKAYELGVLCSVDIAVIIFEQRPGHNVKLYQYCSGDVQEIVTRQTRFDGERETRGPPDFSGAAATKLEDTAEGDEEEQDEEDEVIPTLGSKRRNDGSKAATDLALNIDVSNAHPRTAFLVPALTQSRWIIGLEHNAPRPRRHCRSRATATRRRAKSSVSNHACCLQAAQALRYRLGGSRTHPRCGGHLATRTAAAATTAVLTIRGSRLCRRRLIRFPGLGANAAITSTQWAQHRHGHQHTGTQAAIHS
ncbi:hypothetical protein FB45DRAFT_893339 [Roridomyces roridus]|uniref:MADS-box domain-containing protein n=1 Tax=Roridomyces roridus TaxID=1738132 RepID=A0AAD7CHJ5_9AGAR|nr:hypothetical protein FB45DRAFT_893339 [Roridomyces roridus]